MSCMLAASTFLFELRGLSPAGLAQVRLKMFALTSVKGVLNVPSSEQRVLDLPCDRFRSDHGPTSGTATSHSGSGRPRGASAGSYSRSEHARLCQSERIG